MKAYYIHWSYPPNADDSLFYGGKDDKRLFHHKENAEKVAKSIINKNNRIRNRVAYLYTKIKSGQNTPEEFNEYNELLYYIDKPDDYTICEREIKFEDEL